MESHNLHTPPYTYNYCDLPKCAPRWLKNSATSMCFDVPTRKIMDSPTSEWSTRLPRQDHDNCIPHKFEDRRWIPTVAQINLFWCHKIGSTCSNSEHRNLLFWREITRLYRTTDNESGAKNNILGGNKLLHATWQKATSMKITKVSLKMFFGQQFDLHWCCGWSWPCSLSIKILFDDVDTFSGCFRPIFTRWTIFGFAGAVSMFVDVLPVWCRDDEWVLNTLINH